MLYLNPSFLGLIFVVRAKNAEFLPYWKIVNIWHAWDDKFCDMYFQVKVIDTVEVFIGWEWEARILERFCEYTVDGVPGWGVSEWHYRHFGGRPQKYEDQDPPEVKDVPKYWQVTPKQNISEIYIQYGSVMKRCLFRHLTPYTFFLSSHVVQVQVFFRKEIIRFTAQRFPYHKLPLLLSTKMLFRAEDTRLYLLWKYVSKYIYNHSINPKIMHKRYQK